jgi:hypothetical protein
VSLALLLPALPVALPSIAHAAACGTHASVSYPNDPSFASAEPSTGQTWDNEDWYLYGCVPQTAPLSSDPEGASGMNVSTLWNRTTGPHPYPNRGDNVVVSYMEGGVNWRIASSCELKDRALLNTGELPYPQDSTGHDQGTYDLNHDGVVNVEDYLNDPRIPAAEAGMQRSPGLTSLPFLHQVCAGVGSANGVGYAPTNITPEDLIVAFGHCKIDSATHQIDAVVGCPAGGHFDNDGNGYPNDINGWNFNRDNNDPQTEQSVYAHFNDESGQLAGEGNNSTSSIGLCPLCRYVPIKAGDEAIDRPDRVAEAIVYASNIGVNVLDVTSASLGLNPSVQGAINYAWSRGSVVVFASNDFESADHTDGMFYAHVWPGNSLTGDHSTRSGTSCAPPNQTSAYCLWVLSNTTFRSRSSLTSYGPHALFSVPNNDGSTSTGTPTNAGVAALVVSELKAAAGRQEISNMSPSADEVKQIVRATALPIQDPGCSPNSFVSVEPCFAGPANTSWNIFYGYGRPNVLAAAETIDGNHIPPTASINSPNWYQEVDPTVQGTVHVSADVAARRASGYTWQLQYGLGPQPADTAWTTFASGSGTSAQTVSADINTSAIPSSFWNAAYTIDPTTRSTIEQYDVTVRVQVFANGDTSHAYSMGEDRRAFHLHHDPSLITASPIALGSSGDASPTMADIEGHGWLDTILPTSEGKVHAFRPDGSEAPGFPVQTGPAPGMDATPGHNGGVNYLSDPAWSSNAVPRPHDPIFSTAAVGDLTHTGALDIVVSTASGYTYAWDGSGTLLSGFPVLNGSSSYFGLSVPPPDTPYSFENENYTAASPVLAHLVQGSSELDIVQGAGDNAVHAWRPNGTPVPGWPVSTNVPLPSGQRTHDSKTVPTPAIIDINGDGIPDVVVGLDDSILGTGPAGAGVQTFVVEYDGRGTNANVSHNPVIHVVTIQGLIQGYGVAQDFVTQGVESPAVYETSNGPQAVVNPNLFLPYRVDLAAGTTSNPFAPTTIAPAPAPSSCPFVVPTNPSSFTGPPPPPPTNPGQCTLVQFTTSASLGKLNASLPSPQMFQMGSSGVDVFLGITQTPGFGVRVDNGLGGWDPNSGALLPNFTGRYIQGLAFFAAPAVADISGDGNADVIVPADSSALMAFDATTGLLATGFPKWTGGWSVFEPATGDLRGSGQTDIAAATREGYLYLWSTPGNGCTGNSESWHWHQNDWNTGLYGQDTRPPSAIADLTVTTQGVNDVLTFTAVGNDWKCGTAAKYDLFTSTSPITQQTLGQATQIPVNQTPGPSGTHETITIPASENLGYLAIRAEDAAGNIGPIVVGPPLSAAVPDFGGAAAAGVLATTGLAVAALGARRRRKLRTAA